MGFLAGSATFTRYHFYHRHPSGLNLNAVFLELLQRQAFGSQKVARKDGLELGWIAGEHIADKEFTEEKNCVEDCFHFSLRITGQKYPQELYQQFYFEELSAFAKGNPSGRPSRKQKAEAKENARDRIRDLAKDGRFLRSKLIPVFYHPAAREILFGSTSSNAQTLFFALCMETFGQGPEIKTAGKIAFDLMEPESLENGVKDAKPALFTNAGIASEPSWIPDLFNRDFLGNEFLVWLWFALAGDKSEIELPDGTKTGVMIDSFLSMQARLTQDSQLLKGDSPSRTNEAYRGLMAGKLPRRVGITMERQGLNFRFSLSAETFGISSLKISSTKDETLDNPKAEKVGKIVSFLETFDLLYKAFLLKRARFTNWEMELQTIRQWLWRRATKLDQTIDIVCGNEPVSV